MKNGFVLMLLVVVMSACVPPTATPRPATDTPLPPTVTKTPPPTPTRTPTATRPDSPIVTPTRMPFVSPLAPGTPTPAPGAAARIFTPTLVNAGHEPPFYSFAGIPELNVPTGWSAWWRAIPPCNPGYNPPCMPGADSSPIEACPKNCQSESGNCRLDYGCFWSRPEYKKQDKAAYNGLRVHGGLAAVTGFTFGRFGQHGTFQTITVPTGSQVTFMVWLQAWQCYAGADCRYSHMNPQRQAELRAAWGITRTVSCPGDPVCQYPASDIPKFLRAGLPRSTLITDAITMGLRIGIDPTGTFTGGMGSPDLDGIVWGPYQEAWDIWTPFTATARAASNRVTLITHAFPAWPYAHSGNDFQIDDAAVQVLAPDMQVVYLPVIFKR